MVGSFLRFAAAAAFSFSLVACASAPVDDYYAYAPKQRSHRAAATPATTARTGISDPSKPLQCVPYARAHSGVNIFGDAYTWWEKSQGVYPHSQDPKLRSVMMLTGYAGPNRAHLAVVSSVISSREIRIDHANWFNDGAIYLDDPVRDVSADNDWSEVRVWNIRSQSWGTRTYLVRGFIGPGTGDAYAEAEQAARSSENVSIN